MLVVDELKKNDPQLRLVALMLVIGFFVLLTGLWWVQVVCTKEYQSHLTTQAYRTIRIPAVRGKILDREGRVLAENRPSYNLCLYFDDLGDQFKAEYKRILPLKIVTTPAPFWRFWNRASVTTPKLAKLTASQKDALGWQARYNVANRIAATVGQQMGQTLAIDFKKFAAGYQKERSMPFVILPDLNDAQIARFEENYSTNLGVNLQMQALRTYPLNTTAAHLLGELKQDKSSINGEDSDYNYRLPDYRGATGVENTSDAQLHGNAGTEMVQVNSQGYRQSADIGNAPQAGQNITLTIDLDLQRAAEEAIVTNQRAAAHAAVVVMDVHTGDILAMASSPTFNPNDFAQGISTEKYAQLQQSTGERNRATYENYAPGSIFKIIVGLAALENGLNPNEYYHVQPNPSDAAHGCIFVGRRKIKDTAPPGDYNFQNAFIHSSNAYFITNGLRAGIENIIRMGKKFHLGERTGIFPSQEAKGDFPTLDQVTADDWRAGYTANVSIGQGAVSVTPIQMAVMISAIANGGTVLWPRLVDRVEPQDATGGEVAKQLPTALVRDNLNVHQRNLQIIRAAMLQDVANPEGSGTAAALPGLQICAKTGTAQVQDEDNHNTGHNYWFASFAPYQNPKYAVIVMVESAVESGSGGKISGPIARDVYKAILQKSSEKLAMKK